MSKPYILDQGAAPCIRTKTVKGKPVELFRFKGRRLVTEDEDAVKAAVAAGAEIIQAPEKEVEPEPEKTDDSAGQPGE